MLHAGGARMEITGEMLLRYLTYYDVQDSKWDSYHPQNNTSNKQDTQLALAATNGSTLKQH